MTVLIPLYFHRNVTISLLTENKTNKTTKTWNPAGISFGLCQLYRYTKRKLTDNHSLFRVSIFSVLGGLGFQGLTYFIYLSIFFKDLFLILCIWMCVPVYMTAGPHRGQKKVWGLLELELLVSVSCSAWVLGTENNSICFYCWVSFLALLDFSLCWWRSVLSILWRPLVSVRSVVMSLVLLRIWGVWIFF